MPDHEIDRTVAVISVAIRLFDGWKHDSRHLQGLVQGELAKLASGHRTAARLDRADRIVALHTRLATTLVQAFPRHARWHQFLAHAYMQQAKNAWRRENRPEIRRSLERSIEALGRAAVLDPDDAAIHRDLVDHVTRLSALDGT
jgi:hypothetical protein